MEQDRKKFIRSFMVIFISFCMVMSTAQVTHAESVKLSELPAGTVITIGGHSWNVLDPVKGYLQSYHHVGEPTKFDPDNTKTYNPSDGNNIAYYLNNTFYNSLTEVGKAMILNHTWSTGDQYNENASSVTCKVGVISRSEFDTYKPFMSHAVTAYFWSRTPFSGIPISVYVVNPGMVENEKKEVTNLSYMVPTVYISPDTVITNTMINHTVTASMSNTAWGSVSFNGKFEIGQTVKETFAEGASVTVTAKPLPGYKVASWTVNGSPVNSTSNTYTFTNGSTDTSVVANFGPITYQVTVMTPYSDMGSVSGSGQYTNGQNVTVKATPKPGYLFRDWFYEDSTGSQKYVTWPATYTFSVAARNYTLSAYFNVDPNAKNVNLSCDPADGGTANGGGIKKAATNVTVTAVPKEGYRFVGWEQSGSIVSTSTAYTFTVPSSDISLTAKFELIPFKITTSAPIAGERNKAYSYSFTVAGGMGTKTYVVTDGTLPAGLALSTDGKLSGIPTDIGNSTFTVGVTESGTLARYDSKEYTMTINEESLAINKTNPSNGSVGAAYSHSFTATGGTGAKTYAVTAGTLPVGLVLASDGTLSGTPTTIETSNFTITVTDSASTPVTDSNAYSITIAPETLAINKANPASVIVGTPYSHSFTATGGAGEKTYAITAGTLPAGLSLAADGTLSGTPLDIETSTFTVTVTDEATPVNADSNEFTMEIKPHLAMDTSNPASGTVGTAYTHSFTATGGTGEKTYAVTAGNLPAGLSLAADGILSGTPTTIETSTFTVTVTDSATPAVNDSGAYSITIAPANLAINKGNPASVVVGTPYSHNFTAIGGTGEKTYAVTAGNLPAGLSLAADGTLSGTPTAIETSTFTVTVTDSATPAVSDSNAYTMIINPDSLIINTSNPASGTIGTTYTHRFTATGGTGEKTYSVATGSLPAGLSLAADGTLSGTPTAIETSTFTVTVTDSATPPVSASNIYTMTINPKNSGGNSHSGGGSGSPSSEKVNTSTITKVTTNLNQSFHSVTSTTTTQAKPDSNGSAKAIVTENQISDTIANAVAEAAKDGKDTSVKVEVKITAASDVNSIETSIPKSSMKEIANSKTEALTVSTPIATVTFNDKSLDIISKEAAEDIKIKVSKVDSTFLTPELKQVVGDRPVFSFNVTSGDKTISQFKGSVTVSVPYTPKAGEDTNSIIIYYINSEGKAEAVKDCSYDSKTGVITFKTTHFSQYAVGYNKVNFNDVSSMAWYSDAVSFVAARGISAGDGNSNYAPNAKLTRGQFMVMVMRAYGLTADSSSKDNFTDAGNTYYTGYLATAKKFGITDGTGNNKFAPDKEITRQEMFTLLYNTLKQINELPTSTTAKTLTAYSDSGEVATWADSAMALFAGSGIISGNGGKLNPTDTTNRAEMAQVLYKLMIL